MNKENLVKLTQQVLTEIDEEMFIEVNDCLRGELCKRLANLFNEAEKELSFMYRRTEESEQSYKSVKPILDDAISSYYKKLKDN
mgnify:CR=1 FL=1|tara:strand:- start:55 stop:306 length:252 start_codon:yes stop_codon:yes gene_type:complete